MGNRPIDGVTGKEGGDDPRTIVLSIQDCNQNILREDQHPMLHTSIMTFSFPEHTTDFLDWMECFAEYDEDVVIVDDENEEWEHVPCGHELQ